MVQTLLVMSSTGRCDKDSINPPAVKGFDDCHFLVGVIVGGAEKYTKAGCAGHFFDSFNNVTKERIGNRCHYQADRAGMPCLQTLRNGIRRIAHLLCQTLDTSSCTFANQRALA